MTNIIRLNEAINDYVSRPVITELGEPELAIRPNIYVAGLGANATVEPNQLLIDGNFGQTNPAPFFGVGTGSLTLKSDANGAYIAMNKKGIRTGVVINTKENKGSLVIMKFRINDIFAGAERLFSVGNGATNGNSNFAVPTFTTPVKAFGGIPSLPLRPIDNKVHTIATYCGGGRELVFLDGVKYAVASNLVPINELAGVGINTRSFQDTPPNDIDLYNFEFYADVLLTEQQIQNYLATL